LGWMWCLNELWVTIQGNGQHNNYSTPPSVSHVSLLIQHPPALHGTPSARTV
jgi:hypothetical protein